MYRECRRGRSSFVRGAAEICWRRWPTEALRALIGCDHRQQRQVWRFFLGNHLEAPAVDHDRSHPAVGQNPLSSFRGRRIIDRHIGCAGLHDSKDSDDGRDALGKDDADTIAALDAPLVEKSRQRVGLPVELGVGDRAAGRIDHGCSFGVTGGAPLQIFRKVAGVTAAPSCQPRGQCPRCDRTARCSCRRHPARCRIASR